MMKPASIHPLTAFLLALLALPALGLAAFTTTAVGPDWDGDCGKQNDTGNKPENAVAVSYGFAPQVRTVKGCLEGPAAEEGLAGDQEGDYQDMFKVVVRFAGEFEIATTGPDGFTEFDSLLCVFDSDGRPLLANLTGEQGQPGSIVGNESTNGLFKLEQPGAIYISISGSDSRPLDINGNQLFAFTENPTEVVGPAQGQPTPIAGWSSATQFGEYLISLTGVGPVPPGCGAENTSACDQVHALPFCDVPPCCESVCSVDPNCCEITWDSACVSTAGLLCNQGQPGCGREGAGACQEAHLGPFCDDPICCARICFDRPLCCETSWDEGCAQLAIDLCAPPCDADCPADLNLDGVVGAQDLSILLGSWQQPGCADLDGNNTVDGADLAALLAAWNTPCDE